MNKHNGSILIVSLLFLSVMFCLFQIFYETEILQLKQFSIAKRQFAMSKLAERKLKALEKRLLTEAFTNGTEVVEDSKISYQLERLADYPCVVIENKIARFFKIDVLVTNSMNETKHIASIVAYPSQEESICKENKQTITAGRQSWYQFE